MFIKLFDFLLVINLNVLEEYIFIYNGTNLAKI